MALTSTIFSLRKLTWRVRALVCFVMTKLQRLAEKARVAFAASAGRNPVWYGS